jgi:hypothetical protein
MGLRVVIVTLALWVVAAAEAIAQVRGRGAPEIDGPAGIAALVLLVGAGLLAYNRFRK